MLRIQESLKVFKNLFDSILPNLKSKTGGVIKDLTELRLQNSRFRLFWKARSAISVIL